MTGDENAATATLCRAFDLAVAFRDPELAKFGMRNAIIPVGDSFLEVASPVDPGTSAARFLARHGAGGFLVIVQTNDLESAHARAIANGARIAHRIHKAGVTELQLMRQDVGGCLLSIDQSCPSASWPFAGPDWHRHVRRHVVDGLAGVDIACGETHAVARRWAAVLGRTVTKEAVGEYTIRLDDGMDITFRKRTDRSPDRLVGVRLRHTAGAAPVQPIQLGNLTVSTAPIDGGD